MAYLGGRAELTSLNPSRAHSDSNDVRPLQLLLVCLHEIGQHTVPITATPPNTHKHVQSGLAHGVRGGGAPEFVGTCDAAQRARDVQDLLLLALVERRHAHLREQRGGDGVRAERLEQHLRVDGERRIWDELRYG